MAKFYKVSLIVFVIQVSIQFSTSMYDIYRGDTDTFSTSSDIFKHVPRQCVRNSDNCSCGYVETFTYSYDANNHATAQCVKDDLFRRNSGCSYFTQPTSPGNLISIQIVHQKDPTIQIEFNFSAERFCKWQWKSTYYTVDGDTKNWIPTGNNPGSITIQEDGNNRGKILQINKPSELLSTYRGMLLKIQIECSISGFKRLKRCLLLKIEGQINITKNTVLPTPTIATFPVFPTTSPTTTPSSSISMMSSSTSSLTSSTSPSTNQVSEMPVKSETEGSNTKVSPVTTKVPKLPIPSTSIPADPGNGESEGDENDSSSLVSILVPVLLLFILLVVLFGVFLYRRRQRSVLSKNRNTENPVTDENSSPVVEELANNNSQPTPNQSHLYEIPKTEQEYEYVDANDRTFALQPQSPKYELPQSPKYEYPENPQSHQYEYPSLGKSILKNDRCENSKEKQEEADTMGIYTDTGVMDSGYSSLVRPPVNNNDSKESIYTHLNNVQRGKEEAGATERMDKPDGLLNAMDVEYTPLVRPSLKNECEDNGYTSLINGRKPSEEAAAREGTVEADELLYVDVMDE